MKAISAYIGMFFWFGPIGGLSDWWLLPVQVRCEPFRHARAATQDLGDNRYFCGVVLCGDHCQWIEGR